MSTKQYDYIIAGAGCAGLSLAMHMVQQPALQQKKILLVDESAKTKNDRTWCFWETEPGLFEDIVYKQWQTIWVHGAQYSAPLSIAPYSYKMIRGIDFYRHCFAELSKTSSIEFRQGKVERFFSDKETGVLVNGDRLVADYVFNSIPESKPTLKEKDIWLLQHFTGWLIETKEPAFDPSQATLMDFRIPQDKGTAFCYVLPISSHSALVEYTLFTASLLTKEEYKAQLRRYIEEQLHIQDYTIKETEFGIIPMTTYRFPVRDHNIINIGTAGGQTKGSSGYTFSFIQQHSKAIAESLSQNGHPFVKSTPIRFPFYDRVLLDVLGENRMAGDQIFTTLFRKNKAQDVLSFLSNASTLPVEIKIISTLPTLPFLKAAIRQTF